MKALKVVCYASVLYMLFAAAIILLCFTSCGTVGRIVDGPERLDVFEEQQRALDVRVSAIESLLDAVPPSH